MTPPLQVFLFFSFTKAGSNCFLKVPKCCTQSFRQPFIAFLLKILRNAIEAFCNASRNRSQRITVTAQRDRIADHIFEGVSFQESGERLRDSFHAGLHMMVSWSDFITSAVQDIPEFFFHIVFDLLLAVSGSRQKNRTGSRFCAFYSFWMMVRHFSG